MGKFTKLMRVFDVSMDQSERSNTMNSKTRYGIILALAATAFISLILFSPLVLAQQSSSPKTDQPQPSTAPTDQLLQQPSIPEMDQPQALTAESVCCPMCQMNMKDLQTLANLKKLLDQAKETAETERAVETLAKITEVQSQLEQWHQAIHKELSQHMQKMHQDMKCPLCGKIAKSNEELSQHVQTVHQDMKSPICGKPMVASDQGKVEQPKKPVLEGWDH